MLKHFMLFLFLLFASTLLFAQNTTSNNSSEDVISFQGYSISVLPSNENTYGFIIFRGTAPCMVQRKNPFTLSETGLQKKEDVYKAAKWIISHHDEQAIWERELSKPLSKEAAKELSITIL